MKEEQGGFLKWIFKNNLTKEQLIKLSLNDRQLEATFFVKEKGKISNSGYQELFSVSKATATRDLTELVEKYKIFKKSGDVGAETSYDLMGSKLVQADNFKILQIYSHNYFQQKTRPKKTLKQRKSKEN